MAKWAGDPQDDFRTSRIVPVLACKTPSQPLPCGVDRSSYEDRFPSKHREFDPISKAGQI